MAHMARLIGHAPSVRNVTRQAPTRRRADDGGRKNSGWKKEIFAKQKKQYIYIYGIY